MIKNYKILEKIPETEIRQEVKDIAGAISREYKGRELLLIGVLNGVFIFFADLVREITIPVKVDFVRLASYGSEAFSSGKIKLTKDIELSIQGRHVIIVEDIIDTGRTLSYFIEYIKEKGPKTVKVCTLINKLERREKHVNIDFKGFELSRGFVVGYGLDYNEEFRYLPYILSLEIN